MNRLVSGPIVAVFILTMACAAGDSPEPAAETFSSQAAGESGDSNQFVSESRKLIRTVDLALTAENTEAAVDEIQTFTQELGGYVSSVDARRLQNLMHYTISLKVPNDQLGFATTFLKGLAESVDREHLTTDDVTDRVIDLEARLRTLNATEKELQALLAESRDQNRGAQDIMAIYRELTEIRSQIEGYQGQLESLEQRVEFSTINVSIRPADSARPVAEGWRPAETARGSVRTLIGALQFLANFAIFVVIVLLPVGLVIGAVVWCIARLWRRLRSRMSRPSRAS